MEKYHFSILSRNRLRIDSIAIMGRDRDDAERKLRQMYRHCEVLSCETKPTGARPVPVQKPANDDRMSLEQIMRLISV
jgi:hypothetical protein